MWTDIQKYLQNFQFCTHHLMFLKLTMYDQLTVVKNVKYPDWIFMDIFGQSPWSAIVFTKCNEFAFASIFGWFFLILNCFFIWKGTSVTVIWYIEVKNKNFVCFCFCFFVSHTSPFPPQYPLPSTPYASFQPPCLFGMGTYLISKAVWEKKNNGTVMIPWRPLSSPLFTIVGFHCFTLKTNAKQHTIRNSFVFL